MRSSPAEAKRTSRKGAHRLPAETQASLARGAAGRAWSGGLRYDSQQLVQKIFQSLRDALFIVDSDTIRITDCNPAATEMFGYGREEMLGRTTAFLHVDEASLKEFQGHLMAAVGRDGFLHDFRFRMKRRDGTVFPTEHSVVPLENEAGQRIGWVSVVRDITERDRAEESLRRTSQEMRAIIDASPLAIFALDRQARIVLWSMAAERMFGWTAAEAVGRFNPIVPAESRGDFLALFDRALRGETLEGLDARRQRKDGTMLDVAIWTALLQDDKGGRTGTIAVVQDITDRKRAQERLCLREEQLRALAAELSLSEQRQRRRIATHLHDHLAQTLSLAKMKVEDLRETTPSADRRAALAEVAGLVAQALDDTRASILDLSPPVLYELGLEAAVEQLLDQVRAQHGIEAVFEDDGKPKPLSEDVRAALYGAVRELVHNVVRHARARHVEVRLAREGADLRVTVEDDGVGFDPAAIRSRRSIQGGFGLFGVAERLEYLGGRADIQSGPGRGTVVTLQAPLGKEGPPP